MLKEAMLALRVTDMEYSYQIRDLLEAAAIDLKMAGVQINGVVSITITEDDQTGVITATDESTITDKAVQTAMITYVRMHFGSPSDFDRLSASYDTQKVQLMHATGYTDYGEEPEPEPEPDPDPDPDPPEPEPDPDPPEPEPDSDPEEGAGT